MTNQYLVPSGSLGVDGGTLGQTFLLICPVCGDRNMTAHAPSSDGGTFSLPMLGDCGHTWTIMLRTAKGQMFLLADMDL
jgi:hypothetical protein